MSNINPARPRIKALSFTETEESIPAWIDGGRAEEFLIEIANNRGLKMTRDEAEEWWEQYGPDFESAVYQCCVDVLDDWVSGFGDVELHGADKGESDNITVISEDEFARMLADWKKCPEEVKHGLFMAVRDGGAYVGINNMIGDMWTSNFWDREKCVEWLKSGKAKKA